MIPEKPSVEIIDYQKNRTQINADERRSLIPDNTGSLHFGEQWKKDL